MWERFFGKRGRVHSNALGKYKKIGNIYLRGTTMKARTMMKVEPELEIAPIVGSFHDVHIFSYFRNSQSEEAAPSESSKESFNFDFETAGLSFFDDDEVGSEKTELQAHFDSFGFGFQDSFLAIREEASKIDAALAADQVTALEEEIQSLRRVLANRDEKVGELQTLLRLKDERIGTLELERDLYKADKNQLQSDIEKYRKVSGRSASADSEDHIKQDNSQKEIEPVRRPKQLDPPSCVVSSRTDSSLATTPTGSSSISSNSSPITTPFPILEKPRHVVPSGRKANRLRGRGFAFCRPKSTLDSSHSTDTDAPQGSSLRLQEQIQEMGQRLQNAISTSEELRRRLAMVSRYYERTIADLQESLEVSREQNILRACRSA